MKQLMGQMILFFYPGIQNGISVLVISQDRMTNRRQMRTDLMRPACYQKNF